MAKPRIFIDGEHGTTGLQIRERLQRRDDIRLISLSEASRKDRAARLAAFAEADVISALQTFDNVWGQLFPAEQTRIVQLLVRRVTVTSEGLVIDVRTDGVSGVMRDMMAPRKKVAAE